MQFSEQFAEALVRSYLESRIFAPVTVVVRPHVPDISAIIALRGGRVRASADLPTNWADGSVCALIDVSHALEEKLAQYRREFELEEWYQDQRRFLIESDGGGKTVQQSVSGTGSPTVIYSTGGLPCLPTTTMGYSVSVSTTVSTTSQEEEWWLP